MQSQQHIAAWVLGQVPDQWFTETPEVRVDRDEILVIGRLPRPDLGDDADDADRATADRSRIAAWREETRDARVAIARRAETEFDRPISWGARCGEEGRLFTTVATPAMTRLRMPEREVLDTLIDGGIARSRSEAIAWCVRLVAERQEEWLGDLRAAIERVHEVRGRGPAA